MRIILSVHAEYKRGEKRCSAIRADNRRLCVHLREYSRCNAQDLSSLRCVFLVQQYTKQSYSLHDAAWRTGRINDSDNWISLLYLSVSFYYPAAHYFPYVLWTLFPNRFTIANSLPLLSVPTSFCIFILFIYMYLLDSSDIHTPLR